MQTPNTLPNPNVTMIDRRGEAAMLLRHHTDHRRRIGRIEDSLVIAPTMINAAGSNQ